MKVKAAEEGKAKHETGFQKVTLGWHIFQASEGIGFLKDSNGKILTNKKGGNKYKIPFVVDDPDFTVSDSHGITFDVIVAADSFQDRDEQLLMNILGAVDLAAKFEKAFPGDRSLFEEPIMDKIKSQLPGKQLLMKITESENKKDPTSPYLNVVAMAPFKFATPAGIASLDKELFGIDSAGAGKKSGKAAGSATEEKPAPAEEADPFAS